MRASAHTLLVAVAGLTETCSVRGKSIQQAAAIIVAKLGGLPRKAQAAIAPMAQAAAGAVKESSD
ncbi:hypothetical protein ATY76_29695 [Rhizobium sp. R339]|nr:hypothetical protein ATY76_29695 [Rhizobium sp. R339]